MTERERRALLRRRPDVASWRNLLQMAEARYQQGMDIDLTDKKITVVNLRSAQRHVS